MDRIAVVLRGHIRTWNYNSQAVFNFYDSIATHVDYYFITWETPIVRCSVVSDSFARAGKEMQKYLQVEIPKHYYTSWGGPAYLSLLIAPYLREQHKVNPYDAVFDTRPDVLVARTDRPITPIAENTLYTTSFTNLIDRFGERNIGMKDHLLVSKPDVYCAMIDRITVNSQDTKECHHDMLDFAKKQGFSVSNSLPWLQTEMTRPTDKLRCSNAEQFFDQETRQATLWGETPNWHEISTEQKEELCDQQNIEKFDYITNNSFIAISNVTDEILNELTKK